MRRPRILTLVACCASPLWVSTADADDDVPAPELIATVTIPGDALDLSGLSGTDARGTPDSLLGSFGSGIDYDPDSGDVIAVCDRGPRDGDNTFACRFHRFHLSVQARTRTASLTLVSTHLLTSIGGGQFVGTAKAQSPAFRAIVGDQRVRIPARLDPESIRLVPGNDTAWVSDEYAPSLDLFTTAGRHVRRLTLPERFAPTSGMRPPTRGRQDNRGFEGLALSKDASHAYLMTQSPLVQDGAVNQDGTRVGINMRLLAVSTNPQTGPSREHLYLLDRPNHCVNELLLEDDTHLLVLERDSKGGASAAFRSVYRVDLTDATDITSIERLPSLGMPAGVTPIRKELLVNLLDPRFGLAGDAMPEKVEGLAWGPTLEDGRRTLLISTDNDLVQSSPTSIWVIAVAPNHN